MFSTTIKRSVATVGVVAGLLAAAVPASAQIGPATVGNLAGIQSEVEPVELVRAEARGTQINAPFSLDVATSEVFELNTFGGDDTLKVDSDVTDYLADAGTGDDKVWNNGDGNDTAKAEGTQVGSEGLWAPGDGSDFVRGKSGAPGR